MIKWKLWKWNISYFLDLGVMEENMIQGGVSIKKGGVSIKEGECFKKGMSQRRGFLNFQDSGGWFKKGSNRGGWDPWPIEWFCLKDLSTLDNIYYIMSFPPITYFNFLAILINFQLQLNPKLRISKHLLVFHKGFIVSLLLYLHRMNLIRSNSFSILIIS